MSETLLTWQGSVLPSWVDYNGHLNDAYYLVAFSYGTEGLMEHVGMDAAGRAATGHTIYTLEVHLNYLKEVAVDVPIEVRTQVLGVDAKRVHLFHTLHRQDDGTLLACSEQMLSNVDNSNHATGPKTAPFAPVVAAKLLPLAESHASLPRPAHAGRSIALPPARKPS